MRTDQPQTIYLKDYQAPEYLIEETRLRFELHDDQTLVHAELRLQRNPARGAGLPPLVLHGEELELLAVGPDGPALAPVPYLGPSGVPLQS